VSDALFTLPPDPAALTARQRTAYEYLAAHNGVPVDELGAALHAARGKHGPADRCSWCGPEGLSVVRSKALRDLITYRRDPAGRLYLLRGGNRPAASNASDQIDELAGTTWEDAFGGAA
jgi:hypothetical protein